MKMRLHRLPANALATAVAMELDRHPGALVLVEPVDHLAQAILGVVAVRRQRVVDPRGPVVFLQCSQDQVLAFRPDVKALDQDAIDPELEQLGVEVDGRFSWIRARRWVAAFL